MAFHTKISRFRFVDNTYVKNGLVSCGLQRTLLKMLCSGSGTYWENAIESA